MGVIHETLIYGRIHLPNIERDYKQNHIVNDQENTAETVISVGERLKGEIKSKSIYPKHDDYKNIKIDGRLIDECQSTQNDIAAIATVDYAIKERKPTCGLGKGSKYRLVINS